MNFEDKGFFAIPVAIITIGAVKSNVILIVGGVILIYLQSRKLKMDAAEKKKQDQHKQISEKVEAEPGAKDYGCDKHKMTFEEFWDTTNDMIEGGGFCPVCYTQRQEPQTRLTSKENLEDLFE